MPSQHATYQLGPDGSCPECGRRHLTATGKIACSGHVRYDRDTYVKGQDRQPLDQPRPCKNPPIRGLDRCKSHGAGSSKAKQAGERRERQRRAEALMTTLGEPIDDGRDYAEVIAERVAQRRGHVAWLLAKVQELDPDALAWGVTKKTKGDVVVPGVGLDVSKTRTSEAKPSVWYTLYTEASRDLEKLCLEAIRVGVEVRRLQIDERTADRMVTMIDGIVSALGHDPNAPETAEIVARHLELVA